MLNSTQTIRAQCPFIHVHVHLHVYMYLYCNYCNIYNTYLVNSPQYQAQSLIERSPESGSLTSVGTGGGGALFGPALCGDTQGASEKGRDLWGATYIYMYIYKR